jgi:hypothetical protein
MAADSAAGGGARQLRKAEMGVRESAARQGLQCLQTACERSERRNTHGSKKCELGRALIWGIWKCWQPIAAPANHSRPPANPRSSPNTDHARHHWSSR